MFSPHSCGFPLGALVSPTVKICMSGVSPVSSLDQGKGSESGVDPRVLHCDCPLFLKDGLNAKNTFHCTLYMRPIKYFYLSLSPLTLTKINFLYKVYSECKYINLKYTFKNDYTNIYP